MVILHFQHSNFTHTVVLRCGHGAQKNSTINMYLVTLSSSSMVLGLRVQVERSALDLSRPSQHCHHRHLRTATVLPLAKRWMSPLFFYLLINEHPGSNMVSIRCIVLIISWMTPASTRTGLNLLVAVVTVLMVLLGGSTVLYHHNGSR